MKLTKSEERLRRESPAYQPDAGWDVLDPQGMNVVMSIRLDARSARRITAIARATARAPSGLIRDWTLERLASLGTEGQSLSAAGVREASAAYAVDDDEDLEALRARYRPDLIDILLVGESRPSGGTFFYRANSNLYYATREAFQVALGSVPPGDQFLGYLQDRGVWLYDLADTPVDRMRGRPRRSAVQARIGALVELLEQAKPRLVVAIKKDLAATVRQAVEDAGLDADQLRVLPFPLYQWRAQYVSGLAALVG
jgi:predicted transcriptional regulator